MITEELLVDTITRIFQNGHGKVRSVSFLKELKPEEKPKKPILEIVVLPPDTDHLARFEKKPFLSAGDGEFTVEPLSVFEIHLKYPNNNKDLPPLEDYRRHQIYSSKFVERLYMLVDW